MSLLESTIMGIGGEAPLYPVEKIDFNKKSATTDIVNAGNGYLRKNLLNIEEQFASNEEEIGNAVRNRTEYYNPDTTEERRDQLEEEFASLSQAARVDADYIVYREQSKAAQAELNASRAYIKRQRELNEARKANPETIEYGLAESYGINVDSDLSQGLMTNFLTALSVSKFSGEDPISITLDTFLRGRSIDKLREKIASAPLEQQQAYYAGLSKALLTDGNILTPDYASNMYLLEQIVNDEYSTGSRIFDDVISLFDSIGAIPAISSVKNTVKGAKQMSTLAKAEKLDNLLTGLRGVRKDVKVVADGDNVRVLNLVTNDNVAGIPKDGTTKATAYLLAKEALTAPEEKKEALTEAVRAASGQTPEEQILSATLPTARDPQAPMDRVELLKQIREHSAEPYDDVAKSKVIEQIQEELGDKYASNVDIDINGTFLSLKTTIGKDSQAFPTYREAKDYIDSLLEDFKAIGIRPEEVKIVGRDASGNLVDAKNRYRLKEYYLQVEHNSDIEFRMKSEVGEAADFASSVFHSSAFFRNLKSNLLTPSAIFSNAFVKPLMASVEYARGFTAKVFKENFDNINKNIRRMSKTDKDAIVNIMQEGNRKRHKFTPQELRERGFTQQQINVLYDIYDAQEKSWIIKNLENSRILNRAGFSTVRTKKGSRIVRDFTGEISDDVIDLNTGKAIKNSNIKEGSYKYELANPIELDGTTYKYGVSNIELTKTPINAFYDDTIGKIPGYVDMSFKENQIFLELDGRTIGVASNRLDAMRRAEAMSKDKEIDMSRFKIRSARENTAKEALEDATALQSRDDISYINQTIAEALENPFESIQLGISKAIQNVSIGPVLSRAKQDFVIQYGEFLKEGTFPKIADEIIGDSREANNARMMFEYIRTLEKNTPNSVDKVYKQFVNGIAEQVGRHALESGGFMSNVYASMEKSMLKAARSNPVQLARQITSIAYITTHPLRQFFLQASQGLNFFGIDPISIANGKTLATLQEGLLYLAGIKKLEPSKEMAQFLNIIDKIGLFRGQSTISFVQEALEIQGGGALKRMLVDIPAKGVIYGETVQQYFQAAALFNKHLRENGLEWFSNRKNLDSFVEQLRILTGSQTPIESLPYERNALSLVMQFVQAPHKMLSMLFNKELPFSIRRNILLTNAVLFGTGYYGYETVSRFVGDIDNPTVAQAIQYGLFGTLVNRMFGMILKTENFSPISIAPAYESAKNIFGVMLGLTDSHESLFDTLSIPAAGFAKYRIAPMFNNFFAVMGLVDNPDDVTLGEALHYIPRLSSGYNSLYKAYLAFTTGNYYDNKGKVLKEGLNGVQAMALALGLQPETAKDVEFKLRKIVRETKKEKKERTVDMVDKLFTEVNKLYPKGGDGGDEFDLNRMAAVGGVIVRSLTNGDPELTKAVIKHIRKNFKDAVEGKETNMKWLVDGINKGTIEMNEELRAAIQHLHRVDPIRAKELESRIGEFNYDNEQ